MRNFERINKVLEEEGFKLMRTENIVHEDFQGTQKRYLNKYGELIVVSEDLTLGKQLEAQKSIKRQGTLPDDGVSQQEAEQLLFNSTKVKF